jgi:hypothetical protein
MQTQLTAEVTEAIFQRAIRIKNATTAAQERANDKSISVAVKSGLYQIQRVTFDAKGKSTVTPLTDYMSFDNVVTTLETTPLPLLAA